MPKPFALHVLHLSPETAVQKVPEGRFTYRQTTTQQTSDVSP
jgi:hypothetical protein